MNDTAPYTYLINKSLDINKVREISESSLITTAQHLKHLQLPAFSLHHKYQAPIFTDWCKVAAGFKCSPSVIRRRSTNNCSLPTELICLLAGCHFKIRATTKY